MSVMLDIHKRYGEFIQEGYYGPPPTAMYLGRNQIEALVIELGMPCIAGGMIFDMRIYRVGEEDHIGFGVSYEK